MTEQIYYSNWNQKLKDGHENYWSDISNISSMIGNDLIGAFQMNYYVKDDEDYLRQATSIAVLQTKEKFGEVRVYCRLGCGYIISKKYSNHIISIAKENNDWREFIRFGKKPKRYSKYWEKSMKEKYPIEPKDKAEFFSKEEERDVLHYRETYFKYFRMFPGYKSAIKSGADYQEYLIEERNDAESYIKNMFDSFEENKINFNWDNEFCEKRLSSLKEREKIIKLIHKIE